MIGFFCATPYHIIASINIALGMYPESEATIVILNHFDIDEKMIESIRNTKIFKDVIVYNSNNKSKLNRIKRLVNVFLPDKTMRYLGNKTTFKKWFFFALDFANLAYLSTRYDKRKIDCEFVFGDDGMGSYVNPNTYKPNELVIKLLTITRRLKYLNNVKKLYVYKPQYVIENRHFELVEITQTKETAIRMKEAVSSIWKLDSNISTENSILYFEQTAVPEMYKANLPSEQKCLNKATEIFNSHAVVKMHPRSTFEEYWKDYNILRTKIPFEAMMIQNENKPLIMLSNCSTAMFSAYLLTGLSSEACHSIFINNLVPESSEAIKNALVKYCKMINDEFESPILHTPKTEEDYETLLKELVNKL